MKKTPIAQRILNNSIPVEGCLVWQSTLNRKGYGRIAINHVFKMAHRVAWEEVNGPIPQGYCIDHLCRNRACVNVQHMEVVTIRENVLRGIGEPAQKARQTHCIRGHAFDRENTIQRKNGQRGCHKCQQLYHATYQRKARR